MLGPALADTIVGELPQDFPPRHKSDQDASKKTQNLFQMLLLNQVSLSLMGLKPLIEAGVPACRLRQTSKEDTKVRAGNRIAVIVEPQMHSQRFW